MTFRVVSIEDESEISELLRIVLRHPEVELHTVDNGDDGLALIRELKPDLVLLDIMMPGTNGWQVYDAIRQDAELCTIPIIMLTVVPERAERRRAFASSEINLYVLKPFDTVYLRREIERMLGGASLWRPQERGAAHVFD